MRSLSPKCHPRNSKIRRGATMVEFAFAAPILIVFSLTLIELARLFTIQNTVENAAMEGARRGIVPGATASAAEEAAKDVLAAVQIKNAKVSISPSILTPTTPTVTVSVNAPVAGNTWIPSRFFKGTGLAKSITLSREMAP
jgi:Flp pilus assembly protein TadG